MTRGRNHARPEAIVLVGVNEWHAMRQRSRHLAHGLAAHYRVLYVNPGYYSAPGFLRDTILGRRRRRSVFGVRPVAETLMVADFPPLFPKGLAHPALGRLNYALLAPLIRATLRRLKMHAPILWLSLPPDRGLIGRLGERLTIYDCMDNYAHFFSGAARRRLAREEKRMLEDCDLVFASSDGLLARCSQHNRNVHLLRNGVDFEHFLKESLDETSSLPAVSDIQSPLIGYAGTIGPWVDVALLADVARTYTSSTLVLLGPVESDVRSLERLPNVRLLGERPYAEIPDLLHLLDVCLIPFNLNSLTRDVNPIKLYEYMALGKPVVSTALPEVARHRDVCYVADSREAFVRLVGDALQEAGNTNPAMSARRQHVALSNVWQQRAESAAEVIKANLS